MIRRKTMGYWNDCRYVGRDARAARGAFDAEQMTLTIEIEEVVDEEPTVLVVPARFALCPTCVGHGHHVNPGVDDEGISAQEFYDDPDFYEAYRSGMYNVTCYECDGERVVPVVDTGMCDPERLKRYNEEVDERLYLAAKDRRDRAYGY
jgi:hypothetical protein